MMKTVCLKYGNSLLKMKIDDKNLMGIYTPKDLPKVVDVEKEVLRSLMDPIGSSPLRYLAKDKKNVVILVSDITRPSPSDLMLPPIIKELNCAGVSNDCITVIFGLGTHRCHTEEEKRKLVGEYAYRNVMCIDHEIENCISIGVSKRGTPVEVFKKVAESDFLIVTGNIELHYIAGYSGGNKGLFPGTCSLKTIQTNHSMMVNTKCRPGNLIDNPVRDDIEEAGALAKVRFIVNVVLNSKKEVVKVVAGDPILAHREGAQYVDVMNKRRLEKEADIVVASCGGFPKDINLYQAQKALENANYAVKKGGSIILAAECKDGLGEAVFEKWMLDAESIDEPLKWIQERFVLGGHKAAVICKVLKNADVILVSGFNEEYVKKIFFTPAKTIQDALNMALKKHGGDATVLVLPYAASTLPYIEKQNLKGTEMDHG